MVPGDQQARNWPYNARTESVNNPNELGRGPQAPDEDAAQLTPGRQL